MDESIDLNLKKQVRACDYFLFFMFILMMATRAFTIGSLAQVTEATGAEIKQVAIAYESNPLIRYFLILQSLKGLLLIFLLPSIFLAVYFYYRRKALHGKFNIDHLQFFVMLGFFVFLINVINDLAFYIGSKI